MEKKTKTILAVCFIGIILSILGAPLLIFTGEIIIFLFFLIIGLLLFLGGMIWIVYVRLKLHEKVLGVASDVLNQSTQNKGNNEQIRRCPNCGRSIPMDARICPYCNKNFEEFL